MDFITGSILSGILYDMLKHQTSLTADNIKQKLRNWLVDDILAAKLENELQKLQLSDSMSETAITKSLTNSSTVAALMKEIKPAKETIITQTHTGTGDNIAGNKITNN